jgi:hypothetical protein
MDELLLHMLFGEASDTKRPALYVALGEHAFEGRQIYGLTDAIFPFHQEEVLAVLCSAYRCHDV